MKRVLVGVTILGALAFLAGCPVYSDGGDYRVCGPTTCYDCPDSTYSDACIAWQCGSSADCGAGYVCDLSTSTCLAAGGGQSSQSPDAAANSGPRCASSEQCSEGEVCGYDAYCHEGDCGTFGCSPGFSCWLRGGTASCVAIDASTPVFDAGMTFDATPGDATPVDGQASASGDASEAGPPPVVTCNEDSTCSSPIGRCIDGQCAATSQLCADSTQCAPGANESCVNGICVPLCSAASPCPIGYGCDLTRGVCSLDPTPCVTTPDCVGGTVCIEGHCAAPCAAFDGGDAGALCPGQEICVNGGCIPDQRATFTCINEGFSGASANQCNNDQVCLHGDCYASCSNDGGGCTTGQVCTEVTIMEGTFAVCGDGANLGSDCDPQVAKLCAPGAVCIDGHCK
jgi:hypothetical protein